MHTTGSQVGRPPAEFPATVRRTLTAVLLAGFASALGVGLLSYIVPLMSLDEQVGGVWLGTAFAGFYLARLMVSPVSGTLSDRFGPRRLLLWAALIGALAPLFHFLVPDLATLYVIQLIMGLVSGLVRPLGMAVIGGNVDRGRLGTWFSLHSFVFHLALLVGPFLGGWLYWDRAMGMVLAGVSVCMGVAFLIIYIGVPAEVRTRREEPDGDNVAVSRVHSVSLYLAMAGRSFGIGMTVAFYPILLALKGGLGGLELAAVFSVSSLVLCVGLPLLGRVADNTSRHVNVVVGMLLSAGGLFALGVCRDAWQFVAFGGVMGVGSVLSMPASMALASGLARQQGRVFGTANAAMGVGFLLGPLAGGFAIRSYQSVGAALQFAAVVGACSAMPMLYHAIREYFGWKRPVAASVAVVGFLLLAGFGVGQWLPGESRSAADDGLYRYTDVAMGTIVNLTIEAESRTAADRAARRVLAAMKIVQQDFDHRNPEGSIGRINHAAGSRWVAVSERAYALIKDALAVSRATGGVFDPTVGALTTSPLYYVLDEAIAESRKGLVDYRKVRLNDDGRQVMLPEAGMALDLGGIAKGAVIDMAVNLLRAEGVKGGIVEAGGDFYCFGDRDWTVGIRHPRSDSVYQTITVREKGVCGSGDYQQFVDDAGETVADGNATRHHHIIDPKNMGSAHESIGVTVVAKDAETADALATALFIMGPEDGRRFLEGYSPDVQAIWFAPDMSAVKSLNFQ